MARTSADLVATFRLWCADSPPPAEGATIFGMQMDANMVMPGTPQSDGALRWECAVTLRQAPDGTLRFRGPCVHGTAREPFLYLVLASADEPTHWIRRWKIDLLSIGWDDAEAVAAREGAALEATIVELRGTRPPLRDGGWTVRVPA